ncbi:Uncharacterized protein GBIM_12905 [Gryllus bimaculatus]|nr:Uncharacterized protein GBIM_12905 [Gryllus bimaculatus]
MAHWFHRNVFKATTIVHFDIPFVHQDVQAVQLCSQLKQTRQGLLQVLPDVNYGPETIESAFGSYFSLLMGLLTDPTDANQVSKLRQSVAFKWTNSLLGNSPQVVKDSFFEAFNICFNLAIWYMKHASMVAAKDDITLDEAKDVHVSLKKAAGIFQFIQSMYLPQLGSEQIEAGDLDRRILAAYLTQCTAEAQEVTLARAVELKHNPCLISSLAFETSKMFSDAAASLRSLEPAAQWKLYLQLKSAFYKAFAYKYCGENLLSQDKCGDAIRALKEALACYGQASELCKEYSKKKGPAPKVSPEDHPFFKRLAPQLKITLEKCERENGFIYHQKVPHDPPQLEEKATYGLTSKKPEKDLPPVKETPVHQTSKEPKNENGCSLHCFAISCMPFLEQKAK